MASPGPPSIPPSMPPDDPSPHTPSPGDPELRDTVRAQDPADDNPSGGALSMRATLMRIGGIVVAAAAVIAVIVVTRPEETVVETIRDPRVVVRVERVERTPVARRLTLLGTARAVRRARVAAQVEGEVVWVSAQCEPGVRVTPTEPLARIDPQTYAIALREAEAFLAEAESAVTLRRISARSDEAKLEEAEAELEAAANELSRKEDLLRRGVVSASEVDAQRQAFSAVRKTYLDAVAVVDSAKALLAQDEARLAQRRAQRDRAALQLERTRLTPPFEGVVAACPVEAGERIRVSDVVFEVLDYDEVVVDIEAPSRQLDVIRTGKTAPGPEEAIAAKTSDDSRLDSVDAAGHGREQGAPGARGVELSPGSSPDFSASAAPGAVPNALTGDLVTAARRDLAVTVSAREGRIQRTGRLAHLAPVAEENTRLFRVEVYVANPPGERPILPGMFVAVSLEEAEATPTLAIPYAALMQDDGDAGGLHVYTVAQRDDHGPRDAEEAAAAEPLAEGSLAAEFIARKQSVTLAWEQGELAVVEGLAPGALLVVSGQENLVDGAAVALVNPSEIDAAARSAEEGASPSASASTSPSASAASTGAADGAGERAP